VDGRNFPPFIFAIKFGPWMEGVFNNPSLKGLVKRMVKLTQLLTGMILQVALRAVVVQRMLEKMESLNGTPTEI